MLLSPTPNILAIVFRQEKLGLSATTQLEKFLTCQLDVRTPAARPRASGSYQSHTPLKGYFPSHIVMISQSCIHFSH